MFSVAFEVNPKPEQWDAYLDAAKKLRPELEQIDGFIDNIRYKSLTREGWILSLSGWRDEKALVRWRTRAKHQKAQQTGRDEILKDYHLRIGQITSDNQVPKGFTIQEQRLDETEVSEATALTIITMTRPSEWNETSNPADCAEYLGLDPRADGLLGWDVFDAILTPGDLALLVSWRNKEAAERFEEEFTVPDGARIRRVRVIRDYGMFDRREAPQYYPDANGAETIHG
ncbi:heme-degrading monooxygenase HmoA [Nitrobacteraceae bacterium AZCC 1564]